MSSENVSRSNPEDLSYVADDSVGGVASSSDMLDVSCAAFELPQMSVIPPDCIVTFRGWFSASKFDFVVPLSVIARMPSDISVNEFAANVTLPDFVESYKTIFVESCDAMSSDIVTFSRPEVVLYDVEDIVGDIVSS